MNSIPFIKMHGLGNDFVVIDDREGNFSVSAAEVRKIGNRRRGVGFDQLLVLEPARDPNADVFLRIFNPNGLEAEACGNGTRCVAAQIMNEKRTETLNIETIAGILETRRNTRGLISVNMGFAKFDWAEIPLAEETDTLQLNISSGPLTDPVAVNVGNPHIVFFIENAENIDLAKLGPDLENHPLFPNRTNVEVASIIAPDKLRLRVWERGAGITEACGSGACAAGVAAHRRGLTGRKIEVILDGGPLEIEWKNDGHVHMTGPVANTFEGWLDPSILMYKR